MSHICLGCDKPMLDGQALNGLLKCHWDCTDETRKVLGQAVADELIQQRVNARLRQDGLMPQDPAWKRLGGSV